MRPLYKLSLPLLSASLLLGCGANPQSAASRGAKAFQSAPPETKAAWNTAMAAIKTNGYAPALKALDDVLAQPGLTPEQGAVVKQTSTALSDQMYEAANKGDANAKAALDELRKLKGR